MFNPSAGFAVDSLYISGQTGGVSTKSRAVGSAACAEG
jgi:hypothetical protein